MSLPHMQGKGISAFPHHEPGSHALIYPYVQSRAYSLYHMVDYKHALHPDTMQAATLHIPVTFCRMHPKAYNYVQ